MRRRHDYAPAFGCFLTRDTDLSQKPYAYSGGDPVNFSDPSGHNKADDEAAAAGAAMIAGSSPWEVGIAAAMAAAQSYVTSGSSSSGSGSSVGAPGGAESSGTPGAGGGGKQATPGGGKITITVPQQTGPLSPGPTVGYSNPDGWGVTLQWPHKGAWPNGGSISFPGKVVGLP